VVLLKKFFAFAGLALLAALFFGCLEEAKPESLSSICRPVEYDIAPVEYSCSFSNNGSSSIPVCAEVFYSAGKAPAARICASVPGQDTITKSSVLSDAPEACFKDGEFSCKLEYSVAIVKEAAEEKKPKEGAAEEAKEGH